MPSTKEESIRIFLADDHALFRKGLINLIHQLDARFEVAQEAANGQELMKLLGKQPHPDLVILDVSMPVMDGHQTTVHIKEQNPDLKVLALTMLDDESNLIRLLKAGVDGYLNKDIEPEGLRTAILSIINQGTYYTEEVAGKLVGALRHPGASQSLQEEINAQELKFIKLCCSDDTYQMIADKMCLSIKTIDGYRGRLFEKLGVKSRVGLVLYALKNDLVQL